MTKPKVLVIAGVAIVFLVVAVVLGVTLLGNKGSDVTTTPTEALIDVPEGCPNATDVIVRSDEAGIQYISTANSNFIHWREDQGLLIFTNYTLNPDDVYSNITQGRVLTVIKLSHKDQTDLAIGTYRKLPEVEGGTVNQYASEFNISTVGLAGAVFDNGAKVEIDYIGSDYVCGSVLSDDDSSSIIGRFIAKYIDKL